MATVRKFMFDLSFDESGPPAAEPEAPVVEAPPPPVFTEEDVARAYADGLAEGHETGAAAERQQTARLAAEATDRLVGSLAALDEQLLAIRPVAEQRALQIGLAVARKLVPELLRREGVSEIEALIRASLHDMFEEPRLVLRVPDSVLDIIKPRVDVLASRAGFDGRVVIVAEDGLIDGDCRIEWADGGVERSAARLSAEIEGAVLRALKQTAGGAGTPATTDTET